MMQIGVAKVANEESSEWGRKEDGFQETEDCDVDVMERSKKRGLMKRICYVMNL